MKITEKQRHVLAHIGEVKTNLQRAGFREFRHWTLGEKDVTNIVNRLKMKGLVENNKRDLRHIHSLKLSDKFMERLLTEEKKK